jgi:serine protease Do
MRTALLLSIFCTLTILCFTSHAASPLGESIKDIEVAPHWIYDDFPKAAAEAMATGKPLLVVVRCVPCPPGKELDLKVMQPDKDLLALEKKFVCVRLIQTNSLDLNVFQYDFDMSWAALFLNADMTVYGRYGSRNAAGKDNSDGLLSPAAFRKAAERALKLHAGYPANKAEFAAKTGPQSEYATPTQIPGLTNRPASATVRHECIHCHMVKEYALRKKWEDGRLSAADLWVYPLPSSIGLTTDLDDGLRITQVAAGSPAAAAGLAAGDELVSLRGQPLISLADIQWALHTAPQNGQLAVQAQRDGRTLVKTIAVRGDWKKSDIAWRASSWYSLRQGVKFDPLPAADKKSRGVADDRLALVVKNLFGNGGPKVKEAGLAMNDVIVAIDGKSEAMNESDFLTYLRLTHGPKDSVKFTILRGSERQEITIPMW